VKSLYLQGFAGEHGGFGVCYRLQPMPSALLERVDRYLDAAPRSSTTPEEVGPFTLFRSHAPWPYYARPRVGLESPIEAADLERLAERCRELALPVAIEWVGEITPSLEPVARESGLAVEIHPLLVLEPETEPAASTYEVEILDADDPRLVMARATADVGFGRLGTAKGEAGVPERDAQAARVTGELRAYLQRRVRAGSIVTAVSRDVLAAGSLIPIGDTAEIVGVATLPAHRRQGLAGAVTRALVAEARRRGVTLVLLSAGSDDVARVYERVGFRRVGTHLEAGAED
jgi:ribosomal protein S18 acetylase RimI-like enzyme